MRAKSLFKSLAVAAIFTGAIGAMAPTAEAGCHHAPCVTWKTVTVWVKKTVPYTTYVTKRDHCGYSYRVKVTRYKTVKVPVTRRVAVYH